jgi:hypothetical protein
MNPQHGQAGHRCDIALVLLNSPVAAATNSQPQNVSASTYTVIIPQVPQMKHPQQKE